MSNEWSKMSWMQVRDAQERDPVVLVPIGCVETHGQYTPTGMEFILADQLARDVAEKTGALAVPGLPYGNSGGFMNVPGTIYVRPEVLIELYADVLRSIIRSGFERILCILYHIPNQVLMERAARTIRDETGVSVTWVNPGALAATFIKELGLDPAARGHGAEPGLSLMRYLVGIDVPDDAVPGSGRTEYAGFKVQGAGLSYNGFPVSMPVGWDELFPETGGYGDTTLGGPDVGEQMYQRLVDYLTGLVEKVAKMDVRNPGGTS